MTDGPIVIDARTASTHFPGIGRAVVGLARSLADLRSPHPIALIHGDAPDSRLPLDRLPGLACHSSPFELRQQVEVRRLLRKHRARLYHSPYYLMPFAPRIPAVVSCYDLIPLTVPGLFDRAHRLAYRLAHALAFRASSAIIVPSHATAGDVARGFPAHARKVRVIQLGGGVARESVAERRHAGDEGHPAVPGGPFLLCAGSNKPHKNLRVVVDALAKIVASRRVSGELRLVLAGPRDPRYDDGGETSERLRRAGRILSLGHVSDETLADLYRRATLFVLPSKAEGFGFPALEAMSSGTPVVCSRIAALEELCGGAAAYFDPENAGQLAQLLERLLDSAGDRERMRLAGLERAAAFSWARAARETMALYEQVLGGRR